jgi:hypothetical protein
VLARLVGALLRGLHTGTGAALEAWDDHRGRRAQRIYEAAEEVRRRAEMRRELDAADVVDVVERNQELLVSRDGGAGRADRG